MELKADGVMSEAEARRSSGAGHSERATQERAGRGGWEPGVGGCD